MVISPSERRWLYFRVRRISSFLNIVERKKICYYSYMAIFFVCCELLMLQCILCHVSLNSIFDPRKSCYSGTLCVLDPFKNCGKYLPKSYSRFCILHHFFVITYSLFFWTVSNSLLNIGPDENFLILFWV